MGTKAVTWSITLSIVVPMILVPMAKADVTSPEIKDTGKQYTKEKALTTYYGTGSSGRLTEASELRMTVEDLIAAGEWEAAIPRARKAVQCDPGDPSGHYFLAKVLTMKFYATKGKIDEKLLAECLREWQLIRYHDADPSEQWEAGQEAKKLFKIAKALEKVRVEKGKDTDSKGDTSGIVARKDAGTRDQNQSVNLSTRVKPGSFKSDDNTDQDVNTSAADVHQIAAKKRLFGLF